MKNYDIIMYKMYGKILWHLYFEQENVGKYGTRSSMIT